MRALRWHGREDIRVDEIPIPKIKPDEVLVKVTYSGICGSEVHEYFSGPLFIPLTPHPLTGSCAPQILGHEFGGKVVEVGSAVEWLTPGTLVTINPLISCGVCVPCRRGRPNLCEKIAYIGAIGDGGHAQFAAVKANNCVALPPDIHGETVVFGEPAGCACHAVKQTGIKPGSSVLVLGGGPIGQLVVQYARLAGARKIYLSEIEDTRIRVAQEIGAVDEVFNPLDIDLLDEILQRTDGLGVDCAIECCGSNKTGILDDTASQAVELTRAEGTTTVLGTFTRPSEFHFNNLVLMERRVIGSWVWHSHDEYREAMNAVIAGKIKVLPLISKKVRIEDALGDGIKALAIDKDCAVKIIIDFT